MAFFMPGSMPPSGGLMFCPAPMPPANGKVRYHYHTANGGPPGDGKPPAPPAPPGTGNSGFTQAPLPHPYGFPPQGQPPNAPPGWACYPPNTGPPPAQSPPPGCTWFPPLPAPFSPGPPAPAGGMPMYNAFAAQGNQVQMNAPRLAPNSQSRTFLAPGNRIHDRVIKADNGTGYLTAEEVTTFHVLRRGYDFSELNGSKMAAGVQFNVQTCDSTWTVQTLMRRLGATDLSEFADHHQLGLQNVAVEQWHEQGNGRFERGTCIMYLDPKAKFTLREVGWGPEHGKAGAKPPVWLMMYP